MDRLFRRAEVRVPAGITIESRGVLGKKMVRVSGHTEDLSIEGTRIRLPGRHRLKPGQPVAVDLDGAANTLAIVRGADREKDWTVVRLKFIEPGTRFLEQLVPIVKSPGVTDVDVTSWSGS